MVRLDPLTNNVTIIHLPGQPLLWLKPPISTADKRDEEVENVNIKNNKNKNAEEGKFYYSAEAINDQNVGVTGGRLAMLSEPRYILDDDDDPATVGPYSLMSVHESVIETLSSSHHLTTITIGERNSASDLNTKVMTSSKSFILNSSSKDQIEKIINQKSPELISPKLVSSWSSTNHISSQTDIIMKNKQSQASLLDWDDRFPSKIEKDESDRVSTPSSSFSSAYTVTEQELNTSETSTNADTQSDGCSNCDQNPNNCCQWSEESSSNNVETKERQTIGNNVNISYIFINNECNETAKDDTNDKNNSKKPFLIKCRSRLNSEESNSNDSVSSDTQDSICRDQRDKEADEIWVSNDATYSCSCSHCCMIEWLFPPIIPNSCTEGLECDSFQTRLLAVLSEQSASTDVEELFAKTMATLMCPVGDVSLQRNHFTNRQRVVQDNNNSSSCSSEVKLKLDSDILKKEDKKKTTWNKENEIEEITLTTMTSTMGNRPSKRFSFLIRSNSLKTTESPSIASTPDLLTIPPRQKNPAGVSASDKAILDRLSQLNLEKSSRNGEKPRARSRQPPCSKCTEPVYPQELVKPTSELFFHSCCFKCFQCGIKLNLGTFYLSPVKQKPARIFCRTHLPAPDGRPNSITPQKTELSPNDIVKCDQVGLRYF